MDKKHAIQYAVTVALNHEETGKNPERTTKIKPFKNKYKWEEINFPSKKDDWNIKFEKIDVMIAFNVLYAKQIYPAYVSKHKSNREKQVLLVIPNGEGWHSLEVKKLSSIIKKNKI